MKIRLEEIAPTNAYLKVVHVSAVPRIGDWMEIEEGAAAKEVKDVIWTPFDKADVQAVVRFR